MPESLRALVLALLIAVGASVLFAAGYVFVNTLLPPLNSGLRTLCLWDCGWYGNIAESGYDSAPTMQNGAASDYGFFPAFPIGAKLVQLVTGFGFARAGLLFNAACSLLFCWLVLLHRRELLLGDERDSAMFLLAFLLSPWSLYNHIPYSEMLFNVSALGAYVSWRRGNFVAAAAFGVVLTATRVSGVLLPVVLALELLWVERHRLVAVFAQPDARFRALGVMPLGLAAVLGTHYVAVGDPLGYFHIQELGWGQGLRDPLATGIAGLVVESEHRYHMLVFVAASLVLLAGTVTGRVPVPLALFGWLVPTMTLVSTPASLSRYSLALFPYYLAINLLPFRLRVVAILMGTTGLMAFTYFWLRGDHWLV